MEDEEDAGNNLINAQDQLDTRDGKFNVYQVVLAKDTNLDILLERRTFDGNPLLKRSCCTAWRTECPAELEIVSHNSNSCFPVEILTTRIKADGEHRLLLFFNEPEDEKWGHPDMTIRFSASEKLEPAIAWGVRI